MTLVYVLLAIPVVLYLIMPLFFRATLKVDARPQLQPVTPTYLPDDVKDYFDPVAPKLAALGFEQELCFLIEDSMPNTTAYVSLWVNRKLGQAASANVLITKHSAKPPVIRAHTEFLTKLAAGASVTTNNSAVLGAFKKTRNADNLSAPRLADPSDLYRLHLWRETKLLKAGAERFIPAPGAAIDWYANGYEESIARQVETGYLQLVGGEQTIYEPTLVGAFAMTWAQLPPLKDSRRRAEDRRAESQAQQATASPAAAPAGVKITHVPGRRAA